MALNLRVRKNNMKRTFFTVVVVILVAAVLAGIYILRFRSDRPAATPTPSATPFSDSVLQVDSPLPGAHITSPLVITGRAISNWYFEASFPIYLTDWDGKIIAQTHAEAQTDWMMPGWVPFKATLVFTAPAYGDHGTLIFHNDNPSGDSIRDQAREITVYFK
jgi:hypothetical protein